jgi:F-type H+-transporting ATPase subunit delta
MAKLVSKTYGDALFELAVEENKLDSMLEEVRAVAEALQENAQLTTLMNHPKIDKENKIQLIENIFRGQVSDELVGLMRMIVEKDHYKELPSVFTYFIDTVKEYRNIGTAYVTSAVELSAAQKKAVEKKLLATTKYVQFEMHYDVDAGLIGGMVIRIGDRVVDSSIKTKLYDLTRELSQIQLKVGECAP